MMSGNQFKIFIAYVQTVLLISIVSSGMLFMHKHTTSTGQIVIHIHPYNFKSDPDASKHHHTDNEIHFLDVVFHGNYLQTDFIALEPPVPTAPSTKRTTYYQNKVKDRGVQHNFLRGPPANA